MIAISRNCSRAASRSSTICGARHQDLQGSTPSHYSASISPPKDPPSSLVKLRFHPYRVGCVRSTQSPDPLARGNSLRIELFHEAFVAELFHKPVVDKLGDERLSGPTRDS